MTPEQTAAYINGRVAAMLAEIYGMVAENEQRLHLGQSMAYVKDDFDKLAEKYGLTHN